MLQCLWNSIMYAMCFYELIKVTFEAKQGGKEHARKAGRDGRNKERRNNQKRDTERKREQERLLFSPANKSAS